MLKSIALYQWLGLSVFAWAGLLALILFVFVAIIGILTGKGKIKAGFTLHVWLARVALILGLLHAGLFWVIR